MIQLIALWGIGLNVAGVLGLFYFGAPFRIPLGGSDMVVVDSSQSKKNVLLDRFQLAASLTALLLVLVGNGLQAWAVLLA